MTGERRRIYWDTCVFSHFLEATPKWIGILDALLDLASKGDGVEILTSTLSITEQAFLAHERADETRAVLDAAAEAKIDAFWRDREAVKLVEYDQVIARAARTLVRGSKAIGRRLAPPDAIHFATAAAVGAASFHTMDKKLITLGPTIQLPFSVGEPVAEQPKLFPT